MASASKRVGRSETIQLTDGTEVELRPLNIKTLKKFMKKFRELENLTRESEDFEAEFMDILVDMAAISLSNDLKEATAYLALDKDDDTYEEAREKWEILVDQDTVAYINEVCGGISLTGGTDADFPKGDEG